MRGRVQDLNPGRLPHSLTHYTCFVLGKRAGDDDGKQSPMPQTFPQILSSHLTFVEVMAEHWDRNLYSFWKVMGLHRVRLHVPSRPSKTHESERLQTSGSRKSGTFCIRGLNWIRVHKSVLCLIPPKQCRNFLFLLLFFFSAPRHWLLKSV